MIHGESAVVCEDPATAQAGSPCCDEQRTEDSGNNRKTPASIDHTRGRYRRRKMSETWFKITSKPVKDGSSWRKFGLRKIPNAKYARSYFRCRHRHDKGCQATKRIQKTDDETPRYCTTYRGHHTCQDVLKRNSKRPASIDLSRWEYKRRKMSTQITPEPVEDGYSWHEYGQKEIFDAKYPRSYFRCIHRKDRGCLATKQIQKTEDETPMYRTTYKGHHTCQDVSKATQLVMDPPREEKNVGHHTCQDVPKATQLVMDPPREEKNMGHHTCQDVPKAPQLVMDPPREGFLLNLESNPATKQELPCFSSFSSVKQEDKKEVAVSDPKTHNNQSSSASTSVFPSPSGSDYGDVSGKYSWSTGSHSSFNMGIAVGGYLRSTQMEKIDNSVNPDTKAKCEVCGVMCTILTTKRGINVGRKFYKCPRKCDFFLWEEHFRVCNCGVGQCKVRASKTQRSKGRQFWCCPLSTGEKNRGCGMFAWIDDEASSSSSELKNPCPEVLVTQKSTSSHEVAAYVKGYLDLAINLSDNNTRMLKDILDSVKKLNLGKV